MKFWTRSSDRLSDAYRVDIKRHMFTRAILAFFMCSLVAHSSENDLLSRVKITAVIPSVALGYSYKHELPQLLFVSLTWDFDDVDSQRPLLAALEIQRLKREARVLANNFDSDDQEL